MNKHCIIYLHFLLAKILILNHVIKKLMNRYLKKCYYFNIVFNNVQRENAQCLYIHGYINP